MKKLSKSNLAKSNNGTAYQYAIEAFKKLTYKEKANALQNSVLHISQCDVTLIEPEGLTNRESVRLYALFFEGVLMMVEQFSIGTTHNIRPIKSFEPYLKSLNEIRVNMLKNGLIDLQGTDTLGEVKSEKFEGKCYIPCTNVNGIFTDIYGNDTHYINHVRLLEKQRNGKPLFNFEREPLRRFADGVHKQGCTCNHCHNSRMAPYRLTLDDLPILN